MANFHLIAVMPKEKIIDEDIDFLLVRTIEGDLGLLSNHSPLVAQLDTGKMKIKINSEEKIFYLSGGFIEFSENLATIICDEIIAKEDIKIENITQRFKEIEDKLKREDISKELKENLEIELNKLGIKKTICEE